MAGATGVYGLRYPELVDPPDGAALGKNLADDVEAELVRVDAAAADVAADVAAWSAFSEGSILFDADASNAGESTQVYRSGGTVTVAVYLTSSSTGSAGTLFEVPVGYRPPRPIRAVMTFGNATHQRVLMAVNGQFSVEGGMPSNMLLYGSMSYVTAEPLP